MQVDTLEVPLYLESVEKQFELFKVPSEIRVALLQPFLTAKTTRMLAMLDSSEIDTFEKFKRKILEEFRLTPTKYRDQFVSAAKRADETWTHCTTRLYTLLRFYLQCRKIDSLQQLINLLVADRLKEMLPRSAFNFISNKKIKDWMKPHEIAAQVEQYQANYQTPGKGSTADSTTKFRSRSSERCNEVKVKQGYNKLAKCFICSGPHFANVCPEKGKRNPGQGGAQPREYRPTNDAAGAGGIYNNAKAAGACFVCGSFNHQKRNCPNRKVNRVNVRAVDMEEEEFLLPGIEELVEMSGEGGVRKVNEVQTVCNIKPVLSSPQKVVLMIDGKRVPGIVDSGAEITCVNDRYITDYLLNVKHSPGIMLEGAFGQRIKARIVELPCRLLTHPDADNAVDNNNEIWLTCAVTSELGSDYLLSMQDYNDLSKCIHSSG
jgi:hypothetical protein